MYMPFNFQIALDLEELTRMFNTKNVKKEKENIYVPLTSCHCGAILTSHAVSSFVKDRDQAFKNWWV